jgi:hypothetical protein
LQAWRKQLPLAAVEILDKQIERFDLVQRQPGDKLVCFFDVGDPTVSSWPESLLFPNRAEELVPVTVKLRRTDGEGELSGDITLHRGRLFSIIFAKRPLDIFERKTTDVQVAGVVLRANPMESADPSQKPVDLCGWVADWNSRFRVTHVSPPLSSSTIKDRVDGIDARLPKDYLEMVSQTDGFEVGNCKVLGLSMIRRLVLPEYNLYVLAELSGQLVVGVKQGSTRTEVVVIDQELEDLRVAGESFREAVEAVLNQSTDPSATEKRTPSAR